MTDRQRLAQARAGDEEAFGALVAPFRRELHAHCYRMLASVEDAEDALQETLLAAWRALDGFEERAGLRTWLYRIATNRCLKLMRSASRRPQTGAPPQWLDPAAGTRRSEVIWLEPYPDALLEAAHDERPGPEARYEAKEAISLAFVTALQVLPPRQRAVVLLRDVLGFTGSETADMLDTTQDGVASALKRARATLERRRGEEPAPPASADGERRLIAALTDAYTDGDVDALLELLADDVRLSMPPLPLEYAGRAVAAQMLPHLFAAGTRYALVETRANGQPAFGVYVRDPDGARPRASALLVIAIAGDRIGALTHFDKGVLGRFGLPRTLP
ncbi:MAG TPA: RNA polymerase subunit sigma-70 [Solirubrobacter sp.]